MFPIVGRPIGIRKLVRLKELGKCGMSLKIKLNWRC